MDLTAIEKAQRVNRERREAGEQTSITHNWIEKAKLKPNSRKLAITAMCFQCFGGTEEELPDSGWKENIRTCTCPKCMMWPFRPYQKSLTDNEIDDEGFED